MAPPRADLSPDKVEDDVMDRIPSLDAEQLEEVCGIVNLDVAEGLKGKRRELKKLLMKYLCTSDDAEDDDKTHAKRLIQVLLLVRRAAFASTAQ